MKRATFAHSIRLSIIALVFAASSVISIAPPANALSGSDFKAGRIIDDEIFNNANAMSVAQIQAFLEAKNPSCDTWGTGSYSGTTRRAYSESKGILFPLVCLKDYYENPSTHENNLTKTNGQAAPIPAGGKSAAELLYSVGQQFSINPQVLLVLLQKEQALVQDDWPWPNQYQGATGYGCPDTAACDSQYYGFYNQIYNAAKQFRRYAQYPNSYGHISGINNNVRYNPTASCGTSSVYIENQSTASLYNYTPYQPNSAALANLYGSGDSCSAYGNRNFWRYFTEWFGSTKAADANRIIDLKKTEFSGRQELFTATYTQLTMYSWWGGSGGVVKDIISTAPNGERILDFDIGVEPNGTTQAAYIATSTGIYKATWSGSTFNPPTKIIDRTGTTKVSYDVQNGDTYRLYVLADDGPYEYWWRSGTSISSGTRLWNINSALDMVKRTSINGADEIYIASKGEIYRMKWPVAGGDGIERKLITAIPGTVSVDKQNLDDGTELLYTVTSSGVYETWWRTGTGFSSPAKLAGNHNGSSITGAQKTITDGYHQLYVAETNGVYEYWWGHGKDVTGNKMINIPQNDVTGMVKTNISNDGYQNIYTAQESFIYETWWGNGKFGNGPAIVDVRR